MTNRKSLVKWIKSNKWKTLLLVALFYVIAEMFTIPFFSIAKLQTENPVETSFMRQRMAEAAEEGTRLKIVHQWVPLSKVPKHVRDAIIVAEDGMFYVHAGVDWHEVWESVDASLNRGKAIRGASTITQQLAKNLYLSSAKTPMRKFKELIIAYQLEAQLSKKRILELYVNVIEWGRGVFGIEAAARTYFGKSVRWLTREEAARLAVVIPSPLRYRPDSNSRYVLRKKQILLRRLIARKRS